MFPEVISGYDYRILNNFLLQQNVIIQDLTPLFLYQDGKALIIQQSLRLVSFCILLSGDLFLQPRLLTHYPG